MADPLLYRLVRDESGYGLWAYALITGLFSVLVFQPELVAGAIFRLADLLNLFISQFGFAF